MKKIYSLFIAMVLMAFSASAEDVMITFDVDVASHLTCTVDDKPYQLVDGVNEIAAPNYSYIVVKPVEPYIISYCQASQSYASLSNGALNYYVSSWYKGDVVTIRTANLDEARTASFTLNIDDPSLVSAALSGYNLEVTLNEGENTIKFDPEVEKTLLISPTSSQTPLYQVKLDGANVVASYGSYSVAITDGCVVDIVAKIPDIDLNITFTYGEGAEGCVSKVRVDYKDIEGFDGKQLTMKAGQRLEIICNTADFKIDRFAANGVVDNFFYGTFSGTLMDDTNFEFDAHKYREYDVTVNVPDPTTVRLFRGYSYLNNVVELTGPSTQVTLNENNNMISWEAAPMCHIDRVMVNGEEINYYNYVQVNEGDVITFESGRYETDKQAVVYVQGKEYAVNNFSFEASTRDKLELVNGYNIVDFYEAMSPFQFSWYGDYPRVADDYIYLNGTPCEPIYNGSSTYNISIADGDIVKIIIAEAAPAECNVTFAFAEGLDFTVKHDVIATLENPAEGLVCLEGTQVDLTPASTDKTIVVKVNDVPVEKNADGNYSFVVTAPETKVTAEEDKQSSITGINVDANAPVEYFNLQGVRVDNPSNGLYIRRQGNTVTKVIVK